MALSKLQLQILDILTEEDREMAGIEIANRVGGIRRSGVYAGLAALQRDGLVSARWDYTEAHPRRMFRLTDNGRRARQIAERDQQRRGLNLEFGTATVAAE